jgi:hypothetical protein
MAAKPSVAAADGKARLSKEARAMGNEAAQPAPGKMPYEAALTEVVKGLGNDPLLLFGIGAGIVLVAVLGVTSSLALTLVVAGVMLVALLAGAHRRAQAVRKGVDIGSLWSSIQHNKFHAGRVRIFSVGSTIENNEIGDGRPGPEA